MISRLESPLDTSKTNVDFSRMIMIITRHVHRGDVSKPAYRVKLKFCRLCDTLMEKKDLVLVRKESSLRNALVERCFEWIKDSQTQVSLPLRVAWMN